MITNNNTYAPRPIIPDLPAYIAKALKANSKAQEFFRELAPAFGENAELTLNCVRRPLSRDVEPLSSEYAVEPV